MRANVGRADACVRWALAVVFLILAAVFHDLTITSLVALLFALLSAGTALTRNCPIYALFHLTTAPDSSQPQHS